MTAGPARFRADIRTRSGRRNGQAMVETIVVMLFLCLVFFGVYEYANLLTAHTVVNYAAQRAARARAVGFNDFMVTKTVRVATASVAGKCRSHDDRGNDLSTATLVSRMGSYLEAECEACTKGILDFELWDGCKLGWSVDEPRGENAELTVHVWQRRPLYDMEDEGACPHKGTCPHKVNGEAGIESHYPFYLQ